jgi:site-specific DNA recombinase
MRAAIYARKSTLQRGDEETKSIARQVADARAFAVRLALPPIDDRHIYADDAVSGADVKNLRARARLIADVEAGKIDTVIMVDMSRFSRREGHEVVAELEQVARKAAVHFYETGSRYVFGDIGTNIANYAIAEANADYRRKVRTKTIAAMKHKAEHGHVLGPAPFGYRNRDVFTNAVDGSGRPIRSHVTREIFEPEANVAREIFDRYAGGQGLKKIADALNRKNTPTPRPRKIKNHDGVVRPLRNRGDWRPSNVRSILLQPLYRGVARWNRLKQHDEKGNPILVVNPESEHVTKFNPDWQIVSNAVAEAVDARFADEDRKKFCAKPGQRARYLLSGGMLLCPACGGRFEVLSNGKYRYYVCATRRHAGTTACANTLALRSEIMDDAAPGRPPCRCQKLRSEYPDEARFVVQQLLGPLTLWVDYDGLNVGDEQGMENVTDEDCFSGTEALGCWGFTAVVTPRGLLNGLVAVSVVAGAHNHHYLQLWRFAA